MKRNSSATTQILKTYPKRSRNRLLATDESGVESNSSDINTFESNKRSTEKFKPLLSSSEQKTYPKRSIKKFRGFEDNSRLFESGSDDLDENQNYRIINKSGKRQIRNLTTNKNVYREGAAVYTIKPSEKTSTGQTMSKKSEQRGTVYFAKRSKPFKKTKDLSKGCSTSNADNDLDISIRSLDIEKMSKSPCKPTNKCSEASNTTTTTVKPNTDQPSVAKIKKRNARLTTPQRNVLKQQQISSKKSDPTTNSIKDDVKAPKTVNCAKPPQNPSKKTNDVIAANTINHGNLIKRSSTTTTPTICTLQPPITKRTRFKKIIENNDFGDKPATVLEPSIRGGVVKRPLIFHKICRSTVQVNGRMTVSKNDLVPTSSKEDLAGKTRHHETVQKPIKMASNRMIVSKNAATNSSTKQDLVVQRTSQNSSTKSGVEIQNSSKKSEEVNKSCKRSKSLMVNIDDEPQPPIVIKKPKTSKNDRSHIGVSTSTHVKDIHASDDYSAARTNSPRQPSTTPQQTIAKQEAREQQQQQQHQLKQNVLSEKNLKKMKKFQSPEQSSNYNASFTMVPSTIKSTKITTAAAAIVTSPTPIISAAIPSLSLIRERLSRTTNSTQLAPLVRKLNNNSTSKSEEDYVAHIYSLRERPPSTISTSDPSNKQLSSHSMFY